MTTTPGWAPPSSGCARYASMLSPPAPEIGTTSAMRFSAAMRWFRGRGAVDQTQRVTGGHTSGTQRAGRQLHDRLAAPHDSCHAPGPQRVVRPQHLPFAIDKCCVDGKTHEEHVDRVARPDEERVTL